MSVNQDLDPMMVMAKVHEIPLKLTSEPGEQPKRHIDLEVIQEIAEDVKNSVVPYDITKTRGTCMDERGRAELQSGAPIVEVRPSAPGGPDVYGLAVSELTGAFGNSEMNAVDRLKTVKKTNNAAGIASGGHEKCAADELFGVWMPLIAKYPELISGYVQRKIEEDGQQYSQDMMNVVITNAANLQKSGIYDEWTEDKYFEILGDEAGVAIEKLKDEPHEGFVMAWVDIEGMTVDQTKLNNRVFELNKPYMKAIENPIANGPEGSRIAELTPYARYAIVGALATALPNPELHEITIK